MADSADQDFGKIAVELKLLQQSQLDEAQTVLTEYASSGMRVRLRDILKDMNFLTEEQIKKVSARQKFVHVRENDRLFCRLAVKRKAITQDVADSYMRRQEEEFRKKGDAERVGELMMNDGAIDPLKFTEILVETTGLRDKGKDEIDAVLEAAPVEEKQRFKTCPTCGNPMPLSAAACKVCQERAAMGAPPLRPPAPTAPPPPRVAAPSAPPPPPPSPALSAPTPVDPAFGAGIPVEKLRGVGRSAGKSSGTPPAAPPAPAAAGTRAMPAATPGAARRGVPMMAIVVGVLLVVAAGGIGTVLMLPNKTTGENSVANQPPSNQGTTPPANTALPDNPEELLLAAETENSVERRLQLFDKFLTQQPTDATGRLGRATCLVHLGKDADARQELDALLKADPKHGAAALWRAWLGLREAAPAGTLAPDLEVAGRSTEKHVALAAEGVQQWLKEDWVRAHSAFQNSLRARPEYYPALIGRARAYQGMGKWKEGNLDLEGALHTGEGSADALFWRGWARLTEGKGQAALDDLSRSMQIGLENPHASYVRALAAISAGNFSGAASTLDRLVQKQPRQVDTLVARGRAYAGQGEFALALADLDGALAIAPERLDAAVERVGVFLLQDERAKAREAADALVQAHPDRPSALLARARASAAGGDPEAARADVRKVWEIGHEHEDALLGLISTSYALGDEREADRAADALFKAFPRNLAGLAVRGFWWMNHGRAKDARLAGQRLLEIAPEDARGLVLTGAADLMEGQRQIGMEALDRAGALAPGVVEPLLARARAMIAGGQTGSALNLLSDLFKDYEKRPFGHNLRAMIQVLDRKTEDAKRGFELALQREPRYAPAINNLGVLALQAGKTQEAQTLFERAIEVDPLLAQAHLNRAFALVMQYQNVREALRSYQRAAELHPLCLDGLMGASEPVALRPAIQFLFDALVADAPKGALQTLGGYARLEAGRIRESVECFRVAGSTDSQDPWAQNGMGLALAADGAPDAAIKAFGLAIDRDPNLAEAYANRGSLLAKSDKPTEALADLDAALKLDDKLAVAWGYRGRVRLDRQEYNPAIADLGRAIELDPGNVMALAARGRAFMESGDFTRALVDLDAALRVSDPTVFPPSERLRTRLNRFTLLARSGNGIRVAQEWPVIFLNAEDKITGDAPDADALDRWIKELSDNISSSESSRGDPKPRAAMYQRRAIARIARNEFPGALSDLSKAVEADAQGIEYRFSRGCAYLLQGELDSTVMEWSYLQRKALQNPGEPGGLQADPRSPYVKYGVEAGENSLYEWILKLSRSNQGLAGAASFESPKEIEARTSAAGQRYAQQVRDDRVRSEAQAMLTYAQKVSVTNKDSGCDLFRDVIKKFPNTTFARIAAEKLKELDK